MEKKARNRAAWREKQGRPPLAPPGPDPDAPPAEVADYLDLENFELFCRTCLVIINKYGERVPFALNSSQRIILRTIIRLIRAGVPPRLIVLKARQVGVSTLVEALLTWTALMKANRSCLVIAHTIKSSKNVFRMCRNFHRFLPESMHQNTRLQSVSEVEYDSGSRVQIEVQGDARSYTAQVVHCSEIAFFEQAGATLLAVMQTVPNSTDSLVVLESTANGMGGIGEKFHKMCMRAMGLALDPEIPEDEKGWTFIFIPWFEHDEYEMEVPAGLPFALSDTEKELMRRHPKITLRKLKWRRWCITTNCDGDEEKFQQEYPGTPEEAFLASGRPAFNRESITHYTEALAELTLRGDLPPSCEMEAERPGYSVPNIIRHERGRLRIFFEPHERHTYIIGADPSEGDPGSDPSPIAVLDQMTMNLAAVWYGRTPPDLLAFRAMELGLYFREGLIIGEANNHGILFHDTIVQAGYPNLYFRDVSAESVAREITEKPGYLTGVKSRENLFNTLRAYVRLRLGALRCPHMIQQIQTAVYIEDKVQAGVGSEKDLLVAFGLCLMAHRGSMKNPLQPIAEEVLMSVGSQAQLLKEREGRDAAEGFVKSTLGIESGMTLDEVLAGMDAALERDERQKRRGVGGMR